jgi:hypothetical protein
VQRLPPALLLLALDDSRGVLHPAASLAIGRALRAAALIELRLLGVVQSRPGQIRCIAAPPATGSALLDRVAAHVTALPSPAPIQDWLAAIEAAFPAMTRSVAGELADAGVLEATEVDHGQLGE